MPGTSLPNLGITGEIPDHAIWGNEGRANDRLLDALVMSTVKAVLNTPPVGTPSDGDRYLVGTTPGGTWSTHPNEIAMWNSSLGGWVYYVPKTGWRTDVMGAATSNGSSQLYLGGWFNDALVVNVKRLGAKGDGVTDDTTAVLAALNSAPAGSRVHFPAGTYLLSTLWTTIYPLNKRLWLSGDGMGTSIIKGTTASTSDFATITAPVRVTDLTFDTWDTVFDFSVIIGAVEKIQFDGVEINNYRRAFFCSNAVGASGIRGLVINGCRITNGRGECISMQCAIMEQWHVTNNVIKTAVLRGIALGNNSLEYADDRGMFFVSGNVVDTIGNEVGVVSTVSIFDPTTWVVTTATPHGLVTLGSPVAFNNTGGELPVGINPYTTYFARTILSATELTLSATAPGGIPGSLLTFAGFGSGTSTLHPLINGGVFGIICYGWRATISNNIVRNLTKYDPVASDVDGIYTKCRYSVIDANVCVDASQAEAAINIKGGAKHETVVQPYGYSVICSHNIILDTQITPLLSAAGRRSNGIKIATSDVMVVNNYLEGLCDVGIYTDSDTGSDAPCHDVTVMGNVVKNHRGKIAIDMLGRGDRVRVLNNLVDGVTNQYDDVTLPQAFGILMAKKEGTGTDVIGNRVFSVGALPIKSVDVATDTFTTGDEDGAISHSLVVNDTIRFNTSYNLPAPLVVGTIYYVISTPTLSTFTISATLGGGLLGITDAGFGNHTVSDTGRTPVGVSIKPAVYSFDLSATNDTNTFRALSGVNPVAHVLAVGDQVRFVVEPGGIVPLNVVVSDPLGSSTPYYIRSVSNSTVPGGTAYSDFTISATLGGGEFDIADNGTPVFTVQRYMTRRSWRIMDNHIDGATYGIHFTWDETIIGVDDVLVRHNTGRNISGKSTTAMLLTDLVKFSDTPTNLLYLPARPETVARVNDNVVEVKNGTEAQDLKLYGTYQNIAGLDHFQRFSVRMDSSHSTIDTEIGLGPSAPWFTCTVDDATDSVTTGAAHGLGVNDPVQFTTTGLLPGGLALNTTYYVKEVVDADTIKLSTVRGGIAPLAGSPSAAALFVISATLGSGVHTLWAVTLRPLELRNAGNLQWRLGTNGALEPETDAINGLPFSTIGSATRHIAKLYVDSAHAATAGTVTLNRMAGRAIVAAGQLFVRVNNNRVKLSTKVMAVIAQKLADSPHPKIVAVVNGLDGSSTFRVWVEPAPATDMAVDWVIFSTLDTDGIPTEE